MLIGNKIEIVTVIVIVTVTPFHFSKLLMDGVPSFENQSKGR